MTRRRKESVVLTWPWAQRSVPHTVNSSAAAAPTPCGSSNAIPAGISMGTTKPSVAFVILIRFLLIVLSGNCVHFTLTFLGNFPSHEHTFFAFDNLNEAHFLQLLHAVPDNLTTSLTKVTLAGATALLGPVHLTEGTDTVSTTVVNVTSDGRSTHVQPIAGTRRKLLGDTGGDGIAPLGDLETPC